MINNIIDDFLLFTFHLTKFEKILIFVFLKNITQNSFLQLKYVNY